MDKEKHFKLCLSIIKFGMVLHSLASLFIFQNEIIIFPMFLLNIVTMPDSFRSGTAKYSVSRNCGGVSCSQFQSKCSQEKKQGLNSVIVEAEPISIVK